MKANNLEKRNGFTLIELLTVIILLGVLIVIIIPTIDSTLKKSSNKIYENQISNIITASKSWASKNPNELPKKDETSIIITLGQLKEEGFIDENIINPKNKKRFLDTTEIIITREKENFTYQVNVE